MHNSIGKLEEYFNDIPADMQEDVRAFLDRYEAKKDTHSATSLDGLTDEELKELLYFSWKDKDADTLPDRLYLCKKLEVLMISAPVENINTIENFTNLKVLEIIDSKISTCKDIFSKLDNLWALQIADNKEDFDFTEKINTLSNLLIYSQTHENTIHSYINIFPKNANKLLYLQLANQNIKTLDNLTSFSNLKYLDLYSNNITFLPKEFFDLTSLEFLDISHNRINNMSDEILKLINLKQLDITENPFEKSPFFKIVNKIAVHDDSQLVILEILRSLNLLTEKDNHNYFTLKIPKSLQTPMLQYIEFFKDYVEATKGKEIIFDVKRDKEGLILVTNGNANVTLSDLSTYFQEYVSLTQQQSEDWIFNFENPTSAMQADILRLKMENEIGRLKSAFQIARLESKHLSNQLSDKTAENEFLRNLSNSLDQKITLLINGKTAETLDIDQLLLDIQDQAVKMLERKSSQQLEDLHNDVLTDFLRQKGYYATDQTRSGRSKLGVGEIDIMIRKKNGTPFSIIEAFRLNSCGTENKTVAQHLDKLLHDYDTAGHERNFVIIYAEAVNFERLWKNYQLYVSELNGKPAFRASYPLISFNEKPEVSDKSSIKIGIAKHRREGSVVEVYHVFINMFA